MEIETVDDYDKVINSTVKSQSDENLSYRPLRQRRWQLFQYT